MFVRAGSLIAAFSHPYLTAQILTHVWPQKGCQSYSVLPSGGIGVTVCCDVPRDALLPDNTWCHSVLSFPDLLRLYSDSSSSERSATQPTGSFSPAHWVRRGSAGRLQKKKNPACCAGGHKVKDRLQKTVDLIYSPEEGGAWDMFVTVWEAESNTAVSPPKYHTAYPTTFIILFLEWHHHTKNKKGSWLSTNHICYDA